MSDGTGRCLGWLYIFTVSQDVGMLCLDCTVYRPEATEREDS